MAPNPFGELIANASANTRVVSSNCIVNCHQAREISAPVYHRLQGKVVREGFTLENQKGIYLLEAENEDMYTAITGNHRTHIARSMFAGLRGCIIKWKDLKEAAVEKGLVQEGETFELSDTIVNHLLTAIALTLEAAHEQSLSDSE